MNTLDVRVSLYVHCKILLTQKEMEYERVYVEAPIKWDKENIIVYVRCPKCDN